MTNRSDGARDSLVQQFWVASVYGGLVYGRQRRIKKNVRVRVPMTNHHWIEIAYNGIVIRYRYIMNH